MQVIWLLLIGSLSFSISIELYGQDEEAFSCSDGLDNDFDGLTDLDDDECLLSSNTLCYECPDGLSFADELLEYSSGCIEIDDYPEGGLGVCDWNDTNGDNAEMVYLGNGGWIRLKFNNNHLMNSGDEAIDLRIIQAGLDLDFILSIKAFDAFTENELIANGFISQNADGFYEIAIYGAISSDLDLDEYLPGYEYGNLKFDAIEIKDAGNGCDLVNGVAGVRIDAVCAMTSQFYSPSFECTEQAYLFQGYPDIGVYEVDLINQTANFITDNILIAPGGFNPLVEINAYGYNPIDNKIWAVWGTDNAIVRINANFKVDTIVFIPEFTDNVAYGSGAINNNGVFSIYSQWDNSFYNIDLDPLSPNYLDVISNPIVPTNEPVDWAFSPIDGRLYTVDSDLNLISVGVDGSFIDHGLTTIIDEDGDSEDLFNAAWMDGNGSLYIQSGDDGDIFRINNPHLGLTNAEYLFTGPQSSQNDAARCNANIPYDCNQVVGGTAIFDECGVCLEPDNPEFNQSCLDCNGEFFGLAEFDECGICLELSDPSFNQFCVDCNGVPNGTWLIDECGECNNPEGEEFNQSCSDCAGVPNGSSILDECEECLLPDSPNFNLVCTDCAGVINGTSQIDECGECNEPSSSEFNLSCSDCEGVPNGISLIDECGECNEPYSASFNASCTDCSGIVNGSFVLDECGECLLPSNSQFNQSCADCAGVPNGNSVLDFCGECLPLDSDLYNNCLDCNGTVSGDWFLNTCNICVSPEELDPDAICYGDLVFVPNSFTPNNDGLNDVFFPSFAVSPSEYSLQIFNHWGEKIFETNELTSGWIGNVKKGDYYGMIDSYTYLIRYRVENSAKIQVLKGHVSLLR